MLVNAKEMLDKAKAGHYAVGHFNINNLEWTKSILLTAEEEKSPVILGVSEGAGKYMAGFLVVAEMVKAMDKSLGLGLWGCWTLVQVLHSVTVYYGMNCVHQTVVLTTYPVIYL